MGHDIRWCPKCRENICESIFERVPHLWRSYSESGRVDKDHEVFRLVQHAIPTFLECTLPDDLREHFKVDCSTGQGVPAKSPRYSFPTMGSTKKGIFVCSQYDTRLTDGFGDYLISIIVGRDDLKTHTDNPSRALREIVEGSREILGIGRNFRPCPQGSYDKEIVYQIAFPLKNAPTAEAFRLGIGDMLGRVAEKREEFDALWFEVLRRAKDYPPEPIPEDIRRRGLRGEEFVLRLEQRRLMEAGRPDLLSQIRKLSPREANHDFRTVRFRGGNPRRHYIHFLEVKTTSRGTFLGTMSRKQSEFALAHPDKTSLVIITSEHETQDIGEVREITSLEDRKPFLHRAVAAELEPLL